MALKITGINVPAIAKSGSTVTLTCSFELNGDQLYSLTWWKDDHTFFKYVPGSNTSRKTAYNQPGITVDVSSSRIPCQTEITTI